MFIPHNTKTINLACKLKYNRKGKNQLVFLMIIDGEKWHYTALGSVRTADGFSRPIRSWSRLFRGITGNNNGDFHCLNCSHSFLTDNTLKKLERIYEHHDYCHVEIPIKVNKILKHNYREKLLKASFTIYGDLKSLPIKQKSCQNNPNEFYTKSKSYAWAMGLCIKFN